MQVYINASKLAAGGDGAEESLSYEKRGWNNPSNAPTSQEEIENATRALGTQNAGMYDNWLQTRPG